MQISLTNKVILVTGASRGLGKSFVQAMAASGATVAIHYGKSEKAAEELKSAIGKKSVIFQANLEEPKAAFELVQKVTDQFGKLDVLVNNAGVAIPANEDDDFEIWLDGWSKTINVNLLSVAATCKAAINRFKNQGSGIIINISSRAAHRGDTREYFSYAASKGGVTALTKSIARAYGKEGIKAFTVAPGFVKTDMAQEFIDKYGSEVIRKDIALQDPTVPDDLAPLVVLLSSGNLDHATGASFDVNAGSYMR